MAEDYGIPTHSSIAQVKIILIDVNEFAPKITRLFVNKSRKNRDNWLKPDEIVRKSNAEYGDIILDRIEAKDGDATSPNNKTRFALGLFQ